jgi:hypothetical protein
MQKAKLPQLLLVSQDQVLLPCLLRQHCRSPRSLLVSAAPPAAAAAAAASDASSGNSAAAANGDGAHLLLP